jgi:signal transduction histidine kinase/ligand-binding sensor domain-containing protein
MFPPARHAMLAGLLASAFAVSAATTNPDWSVHTWQSDDGLPNNNVTGLAQTSDGYLWIANEGRLARFDGIDFEIFSSRTVVPGQSEKIDALLHSRDGSLWMAMDHGAVARLNNGKPEVFTNGVPNRPARTMIEDGEGGIWTTFRGGMVCRIKDGSVSNFNASTGLPPGVVCSLASDTKGRVWFAKDGQVGIFSGGRFQTLTSLDDKITTEVAGAAKGGIWICNGSKLFRYNEGGHPEKAGDVPGESAQSEPTALLEDHAGAVWIGTSESGLFRYNDGKFENFPLSHQEVLSLLEDREGNIWAGTYGGGLNRLSACPLELEGTENGLPFGAAQSLCQDTNGTVWAVTQTGSLVRHANGRWQMISGGNDWSGGRATCVTAGNAGAIWIGTHNHMLECWRDGHFTSWSATNGLKSQTIHALLISHEGDLWIGEDAPDALQCLRAGKLIDFKIPSDVRVIRAIAEDNGGNIWVGSSKGILLRIKNDEVTDETSLLSTNLLSIRCFYTTPDGALWIGFAGWGIGRLKDGHFSRVSTEQGLFDFNISQIVADDRGWMWFGADHGIFKARRQELEDFAGGLTSRVRCIHYGRDEGLPSLQANFGNSPGTLRSRDGRLWIPTRSALAVIDPGKIHEDPTPPPVMVNRIVVDDRTVALYGGAMPVGDVIDLQSSQNGLQLPAGYHRLEFDFTALTFRAPENAAFRYKLGGFDDEWTEAGAKRSATYSRLAAGHYQFQVRACNSDGLWSQNSAVFAFTVAPFFWQTWWFRFAAVLAFTLAVIGVVRYVSFRRLRLKLQSLEQQAALDGERARIARDLHDDLGTRLTQIVLLSGLARRDITTPEKVGEHVENISSAVRHVIKSLDEAVWAVNPRNDTLPHLISYVGQFAVEFLQTADIHCRPDLPEHPPHCNVPAKTRHNLFLALKEALNNVVRHSNASKVRLRITADSELLTIILEDDGQGFGNVEGNGCADGLQNMRQRMNEIGGRFQFESKVDKGTRISFVCPWRNGN